MHQKNSFFKGIKDGLPICFGYLSVGFAFGIFSVESGLSLWQALVISMTNVTSAGQLAAVPIIIAGGGLWELALSQLVINLRYALMSVSLSQKLGNTITLFDRFVISFMNTDEVFAVSSSNKTSVERHYMYGLILTPFLGWSIGTFAGGGAGSILPATITSALGIAIYAMFVAIVIPEASNRKPTAMLVIFAVVLSCIFNFVPVLNKIQSGFVIIICASVASLVFAILCPIEKKEETAKNE